MLTANLPRSIPFFWDHLYALHRAFAGTYAASLAVIQVDRLKGSFRSLETTVRAHHPADHAVRTFIEIDDWQLCAPGASQVALGPPRQENGPTLGNF